MSGSQHLKCCLLLVLVHMVYDVFIVAFPIHSPNTNGTVLNEKLLDTYFGSILLHLFTQLFHKDFSSLISITIMCMEERKAEWHGTSTHKHLMLGASTPGQKQAYRAKGQGFESEELKLRVCRFCEIGWILIMSHNCLLLLHVYNVHI